MCEKNMADQADLSIQEICAAVEAASPALDELVSLVPSRVPEVPIQIRGGSVTLMVRTLSGGCAAQWEGPVTRLRRACEEISDNLRRS
jgi:hypothetical protein